MSPTEPGPPRTVLGKADILADVAYPFEEHDPHLVDYVQQIADLAVGGRS